MSCVIYFLIDTGCNNASFYGSKCEYPCPINCKYNTCHIQNGTCFHVDLGGVEYIAIQVRSHIVHRHMPYWKQILFLCNFNYF